MHKPKNLCALAMFGNFTLLTKLALLMGGLIVHSLTAHAANQTMAEANKPIPSIEMLELLGEFQDENDISMLESLVDNAESKIIRKSAGKSAQHPQAQVHRKQDIPQTSTQTGAKK